MAKKQKPPVISHAQIVELAYAIHKALHKIAIRKKLPKGFHSDEHYFSHCLQQSLEERGFTKEIQWLLQLTAQWTNDLADFVQHVFNVPTNTGNWKVWSIGGHYIEKEYAADTTKGRTQFFLDLDSCITHAYKEAKKDADDH